MSQIAADKRRKLAQKSAAKSALYGSDIDLGQYSIEAANHPYCREPTKLASLEKENMLSAGVILDDRSQRSGTFIQKDQSPIHFSTCQDGLEVMSISHALDKYKWLEQYWWNAVRVDTDKYTAHVASKGSDGYFIRALPGVKTVFPVQACLYLGHKNLAQRVHNIVIAEESSELHIITGCTIHSMLEGLHLGISEFYVKRDAKLTFTMIHNWNPKAQVRPRSATVIEENGIFISNYVLMKPVRSIQMYPVIRCSGVNSIARLNSVIASPPGCEIDIGSQVDLDAEGSRAEIISRAITTGGTIIARGNIQGNKHGVKGHLECRGLILADSGIIHAIPELKGSVSGVDLSHEAAVGKIDEEQIEYLMSRGLTRNEATAIIVRGFLSVNIEGLPPSLYAELKRTIDEHGEELF